MPGGTRGRCQDCLSKVMTRKRLLVGGLAFRAEAAALNDHSLALLHDWPRWSELQLRVLELRDFSCRGLCLANFGPQPPRFLSSGGLTVANLLQTLRGRKRRRKFS